MSLVILFLSSFEFLGWNASFLHIPKECNEVGVNPRKPQDQATNPPRSIFCSWAPTSRNYVYREAELCLYISKI
jgi:hypothetical protein